ncbi:MAG: hypothetical protein ACRC0X_00485 [Brevinema sp.]
MFRYSLLLLFFLPVLTLALSTAPEPESFLIFNSSFNDYPNQVVYYESIPIISQDTNGELLNMIPVISQHSITGEVRLQILFSFFPYIDTNTNLMADNTPLTPYTINITSNRRNISLPALHVQQSVQTTTNIIKKADPLITRHPIVTGSLYLFPEDITNLMLIIRDVRISPNDYHIIQTLQAPTTNNRQIQYNPSTYSLKELQTLYQNNINNTNLADSAVESKIFTGIPSSTLPSPIIPRPDNLAIVLDSPQGSNTLVLPAQYTFVLNSIIQFYFRLL